MKEVLTKLYEIGGFLKSYGFDGYKETDQIASDIMARIKEEIGTNKRFEAWSKCLNKYYKMTSVSPKLVEEISYIYPFRAIRENDTVWVLSVNAGDKYNGGVRNITYHIDESWNTDVTLEEITRDEFISRAGESLYAAINYRTKNKEEE